MVRNVLFPSKDPHHDLQPTVKHATKKTRTKKEERTHSWLSRSTGISLVGLPSGRCIEIYGPRVGSVAPVARAAPAAAVVALVGRAKGSENNGEICPRARDVTSKQQQQVDQKPLQKVTSRRIRCINLTRPRKEKEEKD
ncbi:hypothetical protein PRIPAC_93204 [Pristionchus pacificus]|uniref:Uncharacterized protein n=1 Tax=Pristionchus pacificus TaxID=54126 RepID=A0A2A6C902_PRIPA|nr:hypothetical protein PRIPAC_93204 [Pristionchus pacificus]|eukprot:PDM74682.1 hypothetical protein PRIPAC_43633 [Pristionchus pacificus]